MKQNNKTPKYITGRIMFAPMTIKLASLFSISIMVCCSISCKKLVNVPLPTTQLVTASVFSNDATATSAVLAVYTQMFSNTESAVISIQNGQLADELKPNVTSGTYYQYYTNNMANSATIYGEWIPIYEKYIYEANAVIAGLQQYNGTSPAVKQQLLGEAYFIRAFWHFYLTNCYGAVPLVLTTDYNITSTLPRSSRLQVLQQVVSDLKTAQGLLSSKYVDASDTTLTTDRVRPNTAVAAALLARAYLYLGDYDSHNATDYQAAEVAATSVINNSAYSLCPNLSGASNSVFLKNSSEAIWQLYTPLPASYNTYDGNYFILLAAPSTGGGPSSNVINPLLLNAFESGDQRKVNWVGSITIKGTTYYFPYKYKVKSGGSPITEYTMVLRLAEQYLIRAEARAQQGNIGGAINDLNMIRNRAGLVSYSGPSNQASVLAAILHERQVELFSEWGHRWFDLCRTGNVNSVMASATVVKGGTWNADGHQALYPIPLYDIQNDLNLTQNSGY